MVKVVGQDNNVSIASDKSKVLIDPTIILRGEKGEKGIDGLPGKDGLPGRNGVDGKDGKDGKDGRDGIDGKNGISYWIEYDKKTNTLIFKNDGGLKSPEPIKLPSEAKGWGFGAGGRGGVTAQSDWNQKDKHAVDYIKNKPVIHNVSFKVVDELPLVGNSWTIYLVPIQSEEFTNKYEEWIFVEDAHDPILYWEKLGTEIDLSDYAKKEDLPVVFVGTDGEEDGSAGLVPAPTVTDGNKYLNSDGSWKQVAYSEISNTPTIPTSADYWTVGTSGVSDYQTTYSKKTIFYTASGAQDNGFKMLASSDTAPSSTVGAWSGRCLIGNEKRTFLLGTARNSASGTQSICGLGAHTWGSASSQTSAAWDNVYIQPDGSTGVYLGGNGWRGSSGWFRTLNNNSGSAAYRTSINTGTNSSPAWKTVLPNNTTASNSILFTPTVSTTHSYTYSTSVNGTVTANYGTSYGYGSSAAGSATALGYNAKATGSSAIQLGQGTNSTANTLSVGLSSSLNVQLLDSSGVIPIGRIDLTKISGYDSTVAQTLKHTAGGNIEWVND